MVPFEHQDVYDQRVDVRVGLSVDKLYDIAFLSPLDIWNKDCNGEPGFTAVQPPT